MVEEILKHKEFQRIVEFNSKENIERRKSAIELSSDPKEIIEYKIIKEDLSNDEQNNEKGDIQSIIQLTSNEKEFLNKHTKFIQSRLKRRYHNGEFISYFDDVDFDYRPSIIDGTINEPHQKNFEGPILEKEIKINEKIKKSIRRKKELIKLNQNSELSNIKGKKISESEFNKDNESSPSISLDSNNYNIILLLIYA